MSWVLPYFRQYSSKTMAVVPHAGMPQMVPYLPRPEAVFSALAPTPT